MDSKNTLSAHTERPCLLILVSTVIALALPYDRLATAEVVYDNTERSLRDHERIGPDAGDWFIAQPFNLGENDNISSVTINMSKIGTSLEGILRFTLWDDGGKGLPGNEIGLIGEIDVSLLDNVGMRPTTLPSVDFSSSLTGLTPMEKYFVLIDFRDLNVQFPNSPMFGGLTDDRNTNQADQSIVTRPRREPPFDDNDWTTWAAVGFGRRWLQMSISSSSDKVLQAGDADQDLDFDQLDLVKVQTANKYLTGQAATWGEGDWDGAPGGSPGNPPAGDGRFNQFDIIAAQQGAAYLTGPYAAIQAGGQRGDRQTSVVYDAGTGEVSVDAPAGVELTSINIDSAAGIFTGSAAANLGGSFDNDADDNIFKATFGASFGAVSFGNVASPGLAEDFVLEDLTVVGSLAGGGDLGDVDLIYVPEPRPVRLLALGMWMLTFIWRNPASRARF